MMPKYGMNAVSSMRNQRRFDVPRLLNLADSENHGPGKFDFRAWVSGVAG
jgi:hypothetical protein